jgi:GNAT superfamily N-acetyltransferase
VNERLVIRELVEADISAAQAVMMRSVFEGSADTDDPIFHADIHDLGASYLGADGAFMLVAEDTTTGDLVATGGLRNGALDPEQVPPQLALLERRYRDGGTGQIVRLHVLQERRRRGIGRALVEAIIGRARAEAQYERLALHTHPYTPGALPFWLAMGFQEVLDDMETSRQIFFELPLASTGDDPDPTCTA